MAGMQMVAGTSQKIETLAHEKKLEEIKILMPQLRGELKQALDHLNSACELIRSEQPVQDASDEKPGDEQSLRA